MPSLSKCPQLSCLPHGWYPILPALLTVAAWLTSILQDGCDYARLVATASEGGHTINNSILGNSNATVVPSFSLLLSSIQNREQYHQENPYLTLGYSAYRIKPSSPSLLEDSNIDVSSSWRFYTDSCLTYPHFIQKDLYWKVSHGCNFLADVLGGSGALILLFTLIFSLSPYTWKWAGCEVAMAAALQAFSFIWFQNSMCQNNHKDSYCSLSTGAIKDIVAIGLWFVSSIIVLCYYPAPKDMPHWNTRRVIPLPSNAINNNNNNNHGVGVDAELPTNQNNNDNHVVPMVLP